MKLPALFKSSITNFFKVLNPWHTFPPRLVEPQVPWHCIEEELEEVCLGKWLVAANIRNLTQLHTKRMTSEILIENFNEIP